MKLELKGITKRYGSLVANDHIDLTVEQGQIHALLGENGAGKTTLMNVLFGLVQPDEGEILIDGQPQHLGSPSDAIRAGIGMVHQHFMLVPVFTVAENVTLGMERTRVLGLLDRRRTRRDVRELSERYGLEVNPDALVEDLPVGVQQRVEIIKALLRDASVLILDEPTSVLTPGRDRGTVPHHAGPAGRRPVPRLHLAQAQRGPGDRRHHHGHPARPGGRRAAADHERRRAGLADGGPVGAAAGDQAAGQPGRRPARRAGPHGRERGGQARPGRGVVPGPGG